MRSGRVAHERDAVRVDTKRRGLGADILHRRFDIVDSAGIGLQPRLHQAVLDCKNGIAVLCEIAPPVSVELAIADLPAAAMHGNQHRRLVPFLWQIQIADKLSAIVFGELNVCPSDNLESLSHCSPFLIL